MQLPAAFVALAAAHPAIAAPLDANGTARAVAYGPGYGGGGRWDYLDPKQPFRYGEITNAHNLNLEWGQYSFGSFHFYVNPKVTKPSKIPVFQSPPPENVVDGIDCITTQWSPRTDAVLMWADEFDRMTEICHRPAMREKDFNDETKLKDDRILGQLMMHGWSINFPCKHIGHRLREVVAKCAKDVVGDFDNTHTPRSATGARFFLNYEVNTFTWLTLTRDPTW